MEMEKSINTRMLWMAILAAMETEKNIKYFYSIALLRYNVANILVQPRTISKTINEYHVISTSS